MEKVLRLAFTLMGMILGYSLGNFLITFEYFLNIFPNPHQLSVYIICVILSGIIFYLIYPYLMRFLRWASYNIEMLIKKTSLIGFIMQLVGLIIGLVIALLLSSALDYFPIPQFTWIIRVFIYIILGYIGWSLPRNRSIDMTNFINRIIHREKKDHSEGDEDKNKETTSTSALAKVLDTSVIIDGRIVDIFKTQFIEGPLIIPIYVLNELQVISDSSNDLKRNKGRRGLDIVAKLQEVFPEEIEILEQDYTDLKDVDTKLIRSAKDNNYKIITNDYNLNKVASVQGIDILNINDLANAVKISVLPGELMKVSLIKEGKEPGQAIAYLEDGTMIVVENGRDYIGQNHKVTVTSVLQTSAGRMIFAKPTGV